MATGEVVQRPFEGGATGESHSPFLTDREGAELTAIATLGPLAIIAFDTEPQLGFRPAPVEAPEPEVTEVPGTIGEEFSRVELLTLMRQQHNVAAAAIMFAHSEYN